MIWKRQGLCLLIAAGFAAAFTGCGEKREGPPRFALSGTASLSDGRPIPVGELTLEPDASAGNKGPASMAQIQDGQYSLAADKGVVGGKYIATIIAYDGKAVGESTQGTPLINAPYVEKFDLPEADSTKEFRIK